MKDADRKEDAQKEGFSELFGFTAVGFAGGLAFGMALDSFGFQKSAAGQWLVRTLSGEGESVLEGFYAFRRRLSRAKSSMSEAYGWGKFLFMPIPWIIDLGSRLAGVDVYGIEGFYIPYFYALSDQIGASVSGFIFLQKKEGSWSGAAKRYVHHPVMLASLIVVLVVPAGLLAGRILGFSPTTQTYTALETIAANLCWVPPLVGWLKERRTGAKMT